jgi:hypothetical protein
MEYFICVYLMISAYAIGAITWIGADNKPNLSFLTQVLYLPIAPIAVVLKIIQLNNKKGNQ